MSETKPPPIIINVEGAVSEAVVFDDPDPSSLELEAQSQPDTSREEVFDFFSSFEKKSDTIIIQSCVPAHGPFDEALTWLETIHEPYCKKWGYDYLANSKLVIQINNDEDRAMFSHAWDKIALVRQALDKGYKYVFWIDHDCVIVDFNTDLRKAFDEEGKEIMMCVHPGFPQGGLPSHFNAGVLAIKNSPRVREFFYNVWSNRYSGPPWFEQDVMNKLFRDFQWMNIVGVMGDRFNSTPNANEVPIDQAVIAAFHGVGTLHDVNTRLDYMKKAAEIRKVEDQIAKVK